MISSKQASFGSRSTGHSAGPTVCEVSRATMHMLTAIMTIAFALHRPSRSAEEPMTSVRHRPGSRHALLLTIGLLAAACSGVACRLGRPIFDRDPGPPHPKATISGSVRGADDGTPVKRRTVSAVDTKSGKRYTLRTNDVGDYTFFVPPGLYRLEFSPARGETIVRRPDLINIGPGVVKADVDFVFSRTSTPEGRRQ